MGYKVRLCRVSNYNTEDYISGIDGLMFMLTNLILNAPGICQRYPYIGYNFEARKHVMVGNTALLSSMARELESVVSDIFLEDGLSLKIEILVELDKETNSPTMHLVIKEETVSLEINSDIKGIDDVSYYVKVKDFSN